MRFIASKSSARTGARTVSLLLAFALLAASQKLPSEKWDLQYFYDQNDSSLTFTALKFPSAQRGVAAGFISKKTGNLILGDREKAIPVVLVTADGGKSWDQVNVKSIANSLYFLNESTGWLVAGDGIWMTSESGRSWKRVSAVKGLNRVYFLNADHGFAVGDADRVLETQDGGVTWKPIAWEGGAAPPNLGVVYSAIAFSSAQRGLISGNVPSEPIPADIPVSMLRARKMVSAYLHTLDGGKTWHRAVNSSYGEMIQVSLIPDGTGLALLEFPQSYSWPSEVFFLNLENDQTNHLIYRKKNLSITDLLFVRDGQSLLAGLQTPGDVHPSPIPGKVRMLWSDDLKDWHETAVDYRAVARQVWLASAGNGAVWAATDTGMILKLNVAK